MLAFVFGWWCWLAPQVLGGPLTCIVVKGQSMEPTYHEGDLVAVRDRSGYRTGDIVAYRPYGADGAVVIHRIRTDRGAAIVTRGDNNDRDDPWPVEADKILGTPTFVVPRFGTTAAWVAQNPLALALVAGVIAGIFAAAAPDGDSRRGRGRHDATGDDDYERWSPHTPGTLPSRHSVEAGAAPV